MTPRSTRRRRWPWTLGVLGLGAVLAVQVGGSVLRAKWTEQQLARAIEAAIELATGERAVVGRLEILPSRARVEVDGLVLSHRSDHDEHDGATIMAVDHIGVQFRPTSAGPWIGAVEISQPILRLHWDEDGLREFRDAAETGAQSFPWSTLSLTEGTLVVVLPAGEVRGEGITVSSVKDMEERYDLWVDQLSWTQSGLDQIAEDIHLGQIQLTPNRVVMPEIDFGTEAMTVSGSLAAVKDGPLAGDLSVGIDLSVLDALAKPPTRFEGDLHLDIGLGGTLIEPEAAGAVLVQDLRIHELNHDGEPVQYEVERVRMSWEANPGEVRIKQSWIDWAGGEVQLSAKLDTATTELEAAVVLEGISLADAVRQASGPANAWTTFTGDGELNARGTLEPLAVQGDFDLALIDLLVHTGPVFQPGTERLLKVPRARLRGDIELNRDGVRVHAKDVVFGATSGEVDAWVGFDWFGPMDIQVEMDRVDLTTFRPMKNFDLQGVGKVHGRIHGPFKAVEFNARGEFQDFSMLGIPFADRVQAQFDCADRKTLEFTDLRAVAGQTRYQGAVQVHVSDNSTVDIALELTEGRLSDILGMVDADIGILDGDVRGSVALSGDPYALDGDVVLSLQSVDLLGERFAGGELYSWMDGGRATLEALNLTRWNGEEGVLLRGTIDKGWKTNLDLVATGFKLKRLDALSRLNLPIQGKMTVDARIGGTLFEPEPHGRVAVLDTWFAGHPVPDSTIFFDTVKGVMQLEGYLLGQGMDFSGHMAIAGEQEYRLVASLAKFPLHTVLPQAVDGSPVEAWLSGEVISTGMLGGDDPIAKVDAVGTGLAFRWDQHRLDVRDPWTFQLEGKTLALEGFQINGTGTRLKLAAHTGEDGRVHWKGGGRVDLDLARLGVPGLERADGGGYLQVFTGSKDEGLVVDLATCDATIQGDWFPHPVEGIRGLIRASRHGYRLRSLQPRTEDNAWWRASSGLQRCGDSLTQDPSLIGTIGDGDVKVEGEVSAERWVPTHFDLNGDLKGGRVAFFDFLPAAVGDVSLSFDGDVGADLLLSGQITIDEMMFNQRIEWEDWLLAVSDEWVESAVAEDSDALFALDLVIEADETVRMRNNVADLTASGSLRVSGDTAHPGLTGNIRAEPGGRIHLKEREFELERGELRFVDPLAYDPDLDIVLQTDVRTREQTYDVEYRVLGTYEDWRAETSSQPGLPSADINALLLFGMTRDELERYGGLGGVLAVEGGDLLASKVFLSGRIGSDRGGLFRIVEPLRPDRLDLVSGVSERGSGSLSSDLRLLYENELDDLHLPGTLMIFEQNLTRVSDTYLGLEQRLARTLFARSYWASEQHGRHLSIGGAYGLEMKVRWELD